MKMFHLTKTFFRLMFVFFFVTAVPVFMLTGCAGPETVPGEEPETEAETAETLEDKEMKKTEAADNGVTEKNLTVAVSIIPQKTFVEKIAGDLVEVVLLVPPGNSPGNYEPTPQEVEQFSQASLYFSIGVPTEEANIMPQAREMEGLEIIDLHGKVSEHYPDRHLDGNGCEGSGRRDPHIWLSPARAKVMVETMADEMARMDEANSDVYLQNAQDFIDELTLLDQELEETFRELENRKFIVFHPAFGYLADDYDLEMHALEFAGKEATPQRMQEIIELAKAEDIRAIFYQQEIDSKQTEAFAEEIGGRTVQLAPLAPNYIENLRKMAQTMAEVL